MSSNPQPRRVVPLILGAAMLVVVILSVTLPNPGGALGSTNCGSPPCAGSVPVWVYGTVAGALIVLSLALGLVLLGRRRPHARIGPAEPWKGGEEVATPSTASAAPTTPLVPPPTATPEYLETPDDVGREPPTVAGLKRQGSVVPTNPGVEPTAGSTAAELDRIVREIQKRSQKKGGPPPIEPTTAEAPR